MKKIIIIFSIIGLSIQVHAQKKWTLRECVEYALQNNISIKQSELDVNLADISKKDALGNFLPSLNGSGSHSWNIGLNQNITTGLLENLTTQFTSLGVSSNVDIYRGLRNLNTMRRAKINQLAAQYRLDGMKDNTSLSVANAFLQILASREQLKVLVGQNTVTKENIKNTQELVDAGVIPQGDLLEIQATDATQEQQIINAENNLFLSRLSLAQLLQIEDYQSFDIVDVDYGIMSEDILGKNPGEIFEKAKEELNDIKIAEANAQLAEYDLKIAKGALQPTLSGFYNYSTRASYQDRVSGFEVDPNNPTTTTQIGFVDGTNQAVLQTSPNLNQVISGPLNVFDQFSLNDGHSFGISLNVPIFNGFSASNNVKRNKVELERQKNQLEQTKLDLESTVYQAYNDAKNAKKTYEAALKTEESRRLAFEYAKERYDVGLSNAFDFNQSRTAYENSQSDVVRTKYDYIFRLKILEFYFGLPIAKLN